MTDFIKNRHSGFNRGVRKTRYSIKRFAGKFEDVCEEASEALADAVERTRKTTERIKLLNLIKLLTFLTVLYLLFSFAFSPWSSAGMLFGRSEIDISVILFGFIMLVANIAYLVWQVLLVFQYKPYPDVPDEKLPTCAVIVPAFNEGREVLPSLESVLKSNYPPEKLDIITVNDGSRDDTIEWMKQAAEKSGGRIRVVDLPRNGGKRNAIYNGLLHTKAEVFVTIDSDSEVLPDTVRNLVAPFAQDEKVGGVAGNIRVLNYEDGMIPRMLDVSFVFSFEFIRSAQSVIRSVLCTPGALSAYRVSRVMPFMDEWLNQRFMGRPSNIGEDRAITNIILREGSDVVFQKNSVAFTMVPTSYRGLCRMFIRWARSNVRENLSMIGFTFRHFDVTNENLLGLQLNLIMQIVWMFTPMFFLGTSLYCIAVDAGAFFYSALTVITLWSTLPAFIYACRYNKNESLWSYVYGIFSFIALSWIGPYSLLTVHKSGWLTRQIKTTEEPAAKEQAVPKNG